MAKIENAIIINGEVFTLSATPGEDDCECCALLETCSGGLDVICGTVHDAVQGQCYLKDEEATKLNNE